MERKTIRKALIIEGTGIHKGAPVSLRLEPAAEGIVFISSGKRIPATPAHVVDTRLNTTIGNGTIAISTIEHLMSALYGLSITDCNIGVTGSEMPSMDGSALPFVELLQDAGIEPLGLDQPPIELAAPILIEEGGARIEAEPGPFSLTYEIDFPEPAIGFQRFQFDGRDYVNRIAPARTFGRLKDVEMMHAAGLALGGGLHNAVVVDHDRVINPEGLRFPDEFIRHKVLDLLGDLWTLQAPLQARIHAYKANHALHIRLAGEIAHMRRKGQE
ncbi:MAG TPA: UDP-3-O-acyl-N-acetylglucosamine deacetylase [Desulfomonilia bacterium]|nr:UDP-3-O-acyl-N-acetylglucosamine deacetylase [Desulfomonilia bacterium]